MTIQELTRDQLVQLKEQYLVDWYESIGQCPSWGEIADADAIVDDETIFDYYEGTNFVLEDFS